MNMTRHFAFLITFSTFGIYGIILAQQESPKLLEDTTRPAFIFEQAISKLKGLEYGYSYDIPSGFQNNGTIVLQNPSDYPIVIGDFKKR